MQEKNKIVSVKASYEADFIIVLQYELSAPKNRITHVIDVGYAARLELLHLC